VAQRLLKSALAFICCALFLNLFVGNQGLPALLSARQDHEIAASEVRRLEAENDALRQKIEALRTDPDELEKAAHDLGYVHPGEVVVVIKQAPPASTKR
jgi:cell division protein FtsB